MAKNVLTHNLSEPLGSATSAKVDINAGDGNMTIDRLAGSEQVLASGTLQYLANQGLPDQSVNTNNSQSTFTLRAGKGRQPWFHFPWSACNGATDWQIHLNPTVSYDITAHTDGGNVRLNLTGIAVTRIAADTGGGNMDVVLPDDAADLCVAARSGAGNVTVTVPGDITARIYATSGLGKVIVDSRFSKIDGNTYQSPDYDRAADKVEITLSTGAGNVSVNTK